MVDVVRTQNHQDQLLGRARNLFKYLTESQRLRSRVVHSTDAYDSAVFLADLPEHECVRRHEINDDSGPAAPVLSVNRPDRVDAPDPGDTLRPWMSSGWSRNSVEPTLDEPAAPNQGVFPPNDPDAERLAREAATRRAEFDSWLPRWREWAAADRVAERVQGVYETLFSNADRARSHAEEYELILGVVCLAWHQPGGQSIRRHLFTSTAVIDMDEDTGRLGVRPDLGHPGLTAEIDMIDPSSLPSNYRPAALVELARDYGHHVADAARIGDLARGVVHALSPTSRYVDSEERPEVGGDPAAAFAPAIIFRRRSAEGLVQVLETIEAQLEGASEVPEGLLPLVDPNHALPAEPDQTPGGIVRLDDEPFLAMPVNEKQMRILDSVDRRRQTLVQGPPGTGKTHTAAALLTHLLAQGKRVLVTAQTDRALKEVRAKLPEEVRALSVAIVGQSRSETSDLKTAVERLTAKLEEHDPHSAAASVQRDLARLDELRRERSRLVRLLLDARKSEVVTHTHAGYTGSLAGVARQVRSEEEQHGWLRDHVQPSSTSRTPIESADLLEWLALLNDREVLTGAPEADGVLFPLAQLPSPERFTDACTMEADAISAASAHARLRDHPAAITVRSLTPTQRKKMQDALRGLARRAHDLEQRHEPWIEAALADIRSGREATWQGRRRQLAELITAAMGPVNALPATTRVSTSTPDTAPLALMADAVLKQLRAGSSIKVDAGGSPKTGMFTPRLIKESSRLFAEVRVDGLPPTTEAQLAAFLHWDEAHRVLNALDQAWPADVTIPEEDTVQERLQWHQSELNLLDVLLGFSRDLREAERSLGTAGLPQPNWSDLTDIEDLAGLPDAIDAEDRRVAEADQIDRVSGALQKHLRTRGGYEAVETLQAAVADRNTRAYGRAHAQLARLHLIKGRRDRLRQLDSRVASLSQSLREAVHSSPSDPGWHPRFRSLAAAWAWASTRDWLSDQGLADGNAVQRELHGNELSIHTVVSRLAATRAWDHALAPDRLTGQARADLNSYAQLVKRLGKGTGKYAAKQRVEIQQAMSNCAAAVPVWIMPLYRIAEQLRVHEDMFDVVIVDEASQAGLESVFLQYLAPKIVVIGDDKQVSPSAVGIDQQQLRDLADLYLHDDRYKYSWQDPKRSLFDEAKMRFGGTITLTEHRRCVPEIINFSNKIAYEPEGIRLTPVRQFGSDRLPAIQVVHVAEGYEKGTTNKTNPVEAEQIVDQVRKCLADPRYDGLTFGVISLQGTQQAKLIESMLLAEIEPEEWSARDLRCGDAASFQGSERDVVFLSMVAAPAPDRRMQPLTGDSYVQRYNVAVSRAKDQLWLFHTVTVNDCTHHEDMRFQLLDYCCALSRRTPDGEPVRSLPVSEETRVDPFDSLFEQRVHNRLVERGYSVVPQYEVQGYRIDLVVVGAEAKLAIECDGDHWHGPEQYTDDLARQRDLERAGWRFFRIRESHYYVDRATTLHALWQALDDMEIFASGATPSKEHQQAAPRRVLTVNQDDEIMADDDLAADPDPPDTPVDSFAESDSTLADMENEQGVSDGTLPEYIPYAGPRLPHPTDAHSDDVMSAVHAIVSVEGPVTAERIIAAYLRNSDVSRAGRVIKNALSQALGRGLRQGLLVADPTAGLLLSRTYRLPDQPPYRLRQAGVRPLQQVPVRELTELLRNTFDSEEGNVTEVFKSVLGQLGFQRLTQDAHQRLNRAARLMDEGE